ncbi:MAG TPA: type I phosphomannose isomerase catalytic subunit [Acidobacteriaceae bacterium]|nr:type I phosphomannose isomerase catalytic subunit [Acidobacteriaceae bacterium]
MESKGLGPFRLAPWFSERPWGRPDLRPWYMSTGTSEPVGEAWLTGPQCVVETGALKGWTLAQAAAEESERLLGAGGRELLGKDGNAEFPLLVKLLFPNQKLSVQVHPDDAMARELGEPRGKTECWYLVEAEPEAAIALGLCDGVTVEAVQAAVDGVHRAGQTMEDLLEWVPVTAGEMVFVDAGTVHAIGPGVVLLETQQTSDTTFRLYDYGRGRELHLEQGLRAMKARTAAGKVQPRAMDGFIRLIEQKYFVVDRYDVAAGGEAMVRVEGAGCVVGLSGEAVVKSEGFEAVELPVGRAVVVPVECGEVRVKSSTGASFVRCFAP